MAVTYVDAGPVEKFTDPDGSVFWPDGASAGDLALLTVASKDPFDAATTPDGWELIRVHTGGAGTAGADSGDATIQVFWREANGTEDSSTSFTVAAPSVKVALAQVLVFTHDDPDGSWVLDTAEGTDDTPGTGWSAASATPLSVATGDMVLTASAINTGNRTFSSPAVTIGSATFSGDTEVLDDVASGLSSWHAGAVNTVHTVTGDGTGDPTFTMTGSGTAADEPAGVTAIIHIAHAPEPDPVTTPDLADGIVGVRVFLDEEEIDCDLVGRIAIGSQGFTLYKQGSPHTATFDLLVPWDHAYATADKVQIIATMIEHDYTPGPDVYENTGAGTWEWCVFKGTIEDRQGVGPRLFGSRAIRCRAVGTDSNVFNKRVAISDFAGTGLRGLLEEVSDAVAGGHDGAGKNGFPDEKYGAVDNEDFEERQTAGAILYPTMAGWGCWATHEWPWDGDPENTTFRWRPFAVLLGQAGDANMEEYANQWRESRAIRRPWLLEYVDAGTAKGDAYRKVVLTGRNFSGPTKGSAEWTYDGIGQRSIRIDTEFNTDALCEDRAQGLIDRQPDGQENRLYAIRVNINAYLYQSLAFDEETDIGHSLHHECYALLHGTRLGDIIILNLPRDGWTHWPEEFEPIGDELASLMVQNNDGQSAGYLSGRTLEWVPQSGWTVTFSIRNHN